jgi:hypothetical protein
MVERPNSEARRSSRGPSEITSAHPVVINRIELPVKAHPLFAVRAERDLWALQEIGFPAQLVMRADLSTRRVPAGPFELRLVCGLLAQRLRHELEGRNLDRHSGVTAAASIFFQATSTMWGASPACRQSGSMPALPPKTDIARTRGVRPFCAAFGPRSHNMLSNGLRDFCLADCGIIYVFVCFDCYKTTSFIHSY